MTIPSRPEFEIIDSFDLDSAHGEDHQAQYTERRKACTCYFPLQQQQPPQSSPLQQHFSQQQDSSQQSQQATAATAVAGADFPPKNGKTARTMDANFMSKG